MSLRLATDRWPRLVLNVKAQYMRTKDCSKRKGLVPMAVLPLFPNDMIYSRSKLARDELHFALQLLARIRFSFRIKGTHEMLFA